MEGELIVLNKGNWIYSTLMVLVAIFFFVFSANFEGNARLWPKLFSIILILLSTGLIIETTIKAKHHKQKVNTMNLRKNLYVIYIAIIMLIYLLIMRIIGFLVLTPIFVGIVLWILNYRKVKTIILLSTTFTIAILIVFQFMLNIPLPQGVLEVIFV